MKYGTLFAFRLYNIDSNISITENFNFKVQFKFLNNIVNNIITNYRGIIFTDFLYL
jgi:hypothetical protein